MLCPQLCHLGAPRASLLSQALSYVSEMGPWVTLKASPMAEARQPGTD